MFQQFGNVKKEIREDESYRSFVKGTAAFFGAIFDAFARIGILKETVYIAQPQDSLICAGCADTEWRSHNENLQVWQTSENAVSVAVCGSGFEADILRYDEDLIHGKPTRDKLVLEVIPHVKSVLKRYGKLDENGTMNVCIAFADADRAFVLTTGFCVFEIVNFGAYGDGSEIATASLEMTKDQLPHDRLRFAAKMIEQEYHTRIFPLGTVNTFTAPAYIVTEDGIERSKSTVSQ